MKQSGANENRKLICHRAFVLRSLTGRDMNISPPTTASGNLLVELDSIVERLRLAEIFKSRNHSKLSWAVATPRFWQNMPGEIWNEISSASNVS